MSVVAFGIAAAEPAHARESDRLASTVPPTQGPPLRPYSLSQHLGQRQMMTTFTSRSTKEVGKHSLYYMYTAYHTHWNWEVLLLRKIDKYVMLVG